MVKTQTCNVFKLFNSRVQKMKFHGEDQSILGDLLLRFSSLGILSYSVFNIVAGGLGPHTDIKNLLVFATGAITIIQVVLQVLQIDNMFYFLHHVKMRST